MRPMSVREMDALCHERGMEFDPENLPVELLEMALAWAETVVGKGVADDNPTAALIEKQRRCDHRCHLRQGCGARPDAAVACSACCRREAAGVQRFASG
jgi:hypothetical protein